MAKASGSSCVRGVHTYLIQNNREWRDREGREMGKKWDQVDGSQFLLKNDLSKYIQHFKM